MGFITDRDRREFWRPSAGLLWNACKETDEGAEPYVPSKGPNAGKTTFRRKAFGYSGLITSIQIKGGDFGLSLNIGFDDKIVIAVNARGGYLLSFAQICHLIDLSTPVSCIPYSFQDEQKPGVNIVGWWWKQNGVKLVKPPGLDPANKTTCIIPGPVEAMLPNGKPLLKDGKKVLDWTDRENWLMDHIMAWAADNLLALDDQGKRVQKEPDGIITAPAAQQEPDLNNPPDDEDIPF